MKKRVLLLTAGSCIVIACIFASSHVFRNLINENFENQKQMTNSENEIKLSQPSLKGEMSVEEALQTRRSHRNFKSEALSLQQVSQLLWATYGVTMVSSSGREYKTAPSAGSTYPLEIYLLAGNVDSIMPGLYRYVPGKHSLLPEQSGDLRKPVTEACLGQKMITDAPVSIVFSAVFERTTSRYGKRGEERYVYMDLGHAAQNTYLQATAMGLGTCAVGAFDDNNLQKVLKLPQNEKVLYLMPVGFVK